LSDAPDNAVDDDDFDDDEDFDDEDDYNRADGNTNVVPTAHAVLEYLVRQIVDDPDAVRVEVDDNGRRPSLNVFVAPGDMGRVIGKRGRVAQSIRTVVRAAAVRDGREVEVEFVD
jgi:predicted RNA-binding protein YlqC (UPF0109 family)